MVERRGGLNKEVKWRPSFGGAHGGESSNKEAPWRALFCGAQGGKV